jgi:actin-like ATPase involved in cell morphogenesis
MGSGRRLAFPAAKFEKTPEELSALVLSTLRTNAERALGFAPDAAVVTVPALFELPQTRATSEAARLAGFSRVEHLQEPVASALTAGWNRGEDTAPWLVYDLGGGTFDVSLLETREGVLRVVDHDGDNFLGGRDMDSRLLDYVLARLAEVHGKFSRADPAFAAALRRLRIACEDAKIDLAAGDEASISLPDPIRVDGEEYEVDVPLRLMDLEGLVMPIVDRTVDICLRLLERQGLSRSGVARVVLVGGPTVMSVLRARLQERLAIALALDVDPMTAVAEGAARFASERGLAARIPAAPTIPKGDPVSARSVKAWLQYPSVSGDLFPFVVGRVEPKSIDAVRFEREDGAFRSNEEPIGGDGSFVAQLELVARATTTFRIVASRGGHKTPATPRSLPASSERSPLGQPVEGDSARTRWATTPPNVASTTTGRTCPSTMWNGDTHEQNGRCTTAPHAPATAPNAAPVCQGVTGSRRLRTARRARSGPAAYTTLMRAQPKWKRAASSVIASSHAFDSTALLHTEATASHAATRAAGVSVATAILLPADRPNIDRPRVAPSQVAPMAMSSQSSSSVTTKLRGASWVGADPSGTTRHNRAPSAGPNGALPGSPSVTLARAMTPAAPNPSARSRAWRRT